MSPEGVSDRRATEIELELFTHRFAAVAWQMGEALRRTAMSVNVKERLDFSCALLDPDGELFDYFFHTYPLTNTYEDDPRIEPIALAYDNAILIDQ